MKIIGITTGILCLLLGIAAPVYAQEHNEKQDHPEQKQSRHEEAKPERAKSEPQHAQPAREPEQKQEHAQQQHAQQKARPEQHNPPQHAQQRQAQHNQQQRVQQQRAQQQRVDHHPQRSEEQQRVQRSAWQQHGSQHWDTDHRTWQQRGGYHGYRIPDGRFRGYFGPNHGFRINGLPFLVVGGYPRFQYQGYWLSAVDPWPEAWGPDWYDNDDVYINYVDNGYYMYNRRYPGVGIAINVSM